MRTTFLAMAAVLVAARAAMAAPAVDYLKEVKPIFAEACYKCHGASQQKGGLRVDTGAFVLKGGEKGQVVVPGKSADSLLLQVVQGKHSEIARMPYKKPPLKDAQIAVLKAWVDQGAKSPADEAPETTRHWSFIPPVREPVPAVKLKGWVRNPVDNFILARLEQEKIKPSPEADRVTLIRRLSLDLTGLPPTIEEVEAFVKDKAPDAYEKLVERLLASPHYGERWGRWWLDVARYADSNGYSIDAPRQIWKYRDWVIGALNRDLPFDQFTIEQLAGDMLPNATTEQKIATGFHRNTQINQEGGIDKEQFRIESIIDRVNTTGSAWLGLTIGCAQCHDHKFDPLAQKEFYGMFAFLNNADEPDLPLGSPDQTKAAAEIDEKVAFFYSDLKDRDALIWDKMLAWERSLAPEERQKQTEAVRSSFDVAFEKRTPEQKNLVLVAFIEQAPENKAHQASLKKIRGARPTVPSTMVMKERAQPRRSYLFIKGDFTRDGGDVQPIVPAVLHALPAEVTKPNRLDLAKWLVDPANPLTARVTINRVWQQYFGKGIVETENDFGTQGTLPTNQRLLDWLAMELMAQKWSLKQMHRLIVTSATYRQSSRVRPDLAEVDANNKLLARQNRLRLDAEIVRDVCLSASGLMNPAIGGPSVHPVQPDGVYAFTQVKREWKPSTGVDRYRRGMYTFFFRSASYPSLNVFDAPDSFSSCTRRIRSNTPLQALTLLNDAAFYDLADGLAKRVIKEGPNGDAAKLEYAFRLCLARAPSSFEAKRLAEVLKSQLALEKGEGAQLAAWTTVGRVLLNLDETITRE